MEVLKKIENNIFFITINRESALNALNKNIFDNLESLIDEISKLGQSIKGVIITGSGSKAFVAGADITEFLSLSSDQAQHLSRRGQIIFDNLENLEVPVIAAVNGFALGGGCELAMACHIRIAGENAKFGQPEVNLGLIPGYGGTQRLTRYVGKSKSIELILTGDMITAQQALELGLVNSVCEAGKEVETAITLIEKIAKKGPNAVAQSLKAIHAYYKQQDGMQYEAELFGKTMVTDEAKEGVTAFLEKRKANFYR
ncbi:MAG: enoyl-CoA hydratase [Saprospiraceae bacterium]|nr:enoyl-CoA hydratase [Saprospiraceae bacterium]